MFILPVAVHTVVSVWGRVSVDVMVTQGEMVTFRGAQCFTRHDTAPPPKKRTETELYTLTHAGRGAAPIKPQLHVKIARHRKVQLAITSARAHDWSLARPEGVKLYHDMATLGR